MILAILNKPVGKGSLRCWQGFLFDTIVQADVEQFMLETHHSGHYFLLDPNDLEKNNVGNYMFRGLWIMETSVHVKRRGIHRSFTMKV